MDIRLPQPKAAAKLLRDGLAKAGIPITHSFSLELIAQTRGYRDWQTMRADTLPHPTKAPRRAATWSVELFPKRALFVELLVDGHPGDRRKVLSYSSYLEGWNPETLDREQMDSDELHDRFGSLYEYEGAPGAPTSGWIMGWDLLEATVHPNGLFALRDGRQFFLVDETGARWALPVIPPCGRAPREPGPVTRDPGVAPKRDVRDFGTLLPPSVEFVEIVSNGCVDRRQVLFFSGQLTGFCREGFEHLLDENLIEYAAFEDLQRSQWLTGRDFQTAKLHADGKFELESGMAFYLTGSKHDRWVPTFVPLSIETVPASTAEVVSIEFLASPDAEDFVRPRPIEEIDEGLFEWIEAGMPQANTAVELRTTALEFIGKDGDWVNFDYFDLWSGSVTVDGEFTARGYRFALLLANGRRWTPMRWD